MPPPRDRKRSGPRVQLQAADIDYKNLELLKRFTTDRGKILPRKTTRIRARNQRLISQAIKRARHLALLPYCSHHK